MFDFLLYDHMGRYITSILLALSIGATVYGTLAAKDFLKSLKS